MDCLVCGSRNADGAVVCRSCGSPLDGADAAASQTFALSAGTPLQSGAYIVETLLGQGGFGITYRAQDRRLSRNVAIKEFFPQAQGCARRGTTVITGGGIPQSVFDDEKSKFLEEGQRLAQFQHPGIVKVHSLFEENSTAYMVMEFLQGKTLLKLVEEDGPVEEKRLIPYIEQIGEALAVIHKSQLIHRDIKPENIMLTADGRAVLVDFGTAREFASGKTRRMTAMVTPGYAPLEQYGQHARFGVFTDVYALGATLYHLLTGQVPVQATDRAAGVELAAPKRLNSAISRQVSDAVMWAMEMKVDKRPQSAVDFIQAIRGARQASTTNGKSSTSAASVAAPNPYEARIQQLISELESTGHGHSRTSVDGEINRISTALTTLGSGSQAQLNQCPCCQRATLSIVEGSRSSQCPICSNATLKIKKLDQHLCAVCQEGHLVVTHLNRPMMFCPVCQCRPLREEKRKRLGLPLDLWWVCPGCGAELDVLLGNKAKLVTFRDDPHGIGREHVGQTYPVTQWQKVAPASRAVWTCDACVAVFYELPDSRLCLDGYQKDPTGEGAKLVGKSFYRTMWSKLANGFSLQLGTTNCPSCEANFDYDPVDKLLKLLSFNAARYPRANAVQGTFYPLERWSLFAAGKTSLVPGRLCATCGIEFDNDGDNLKLVRAPSNFAATVGAAYSFEDWHRAAKGLPSVAEETHLKQKLTQLLAQQNHELARLGKELETKRNTLERQLVDTVKQAFVGGFVPITLQTAGLNLKKDERVLWECSALKLKQRTRSGYQYWDTAGAGSLIVTTLRVLFKESTGGLWSKTLDKVISVNEVGLAGQQSAVVVWIENLQKPLGFAFSPFPGTCTVGTRSFRFDLTPRDLIEVFRIHGTG